MVADNVTWRDVLTACRAVSHTGTRTRAERVVKPLSYHIFVLQAHPPCSSASQFVGKHPACRRHNA